VKPQKLPKPTWDFRGIPGENSRRVKTVRTFSGISGNGKFVSENTPKLWELHLGSTPLQRELKKTEFPAGFQEFPRDISGISGFSGDISGFPENH
jgi:hypothetical protein